MTRYANRTDWKTVTLAFIIWSVQFLAKWGFSVIFPDQLISDVISVALSVAAWGLLGLVWFRARPVSLKDVAELAIAIAALATAFDLLPALIG